MAPDEAERIIAEGILEHFEVHGLPGRARRSLLASAGSDRLIGGRIYDAHVAEDCSPVSSERHDHSAAPTPSKNGRISFVSGAAGRGTAGGGPVEESA